MLEGKSTVYRHPKGNTLYVTIPAEVALDSKCFLKPKMVVTVRIRDKTILIMEETKR
jgi:hypothetical protein